MCWLAFDSARPTLAVSVSKTRLLTALEGQRLDFCQENGRPFSPTPQTMTDNVWICLSLAIFCLGCLKSHCGSWASTSTYFSAPEMRNRAETTEKVVAQHVAKACRQRLTKFLRGQHGCELRGVAPWCFFGDLWVHIQTQSGRDDALRIIAMPYEIWNVSSFIKRLFPDQKTYLTFVPFVWVVLQLLAVALGAASWRFCRFCLAEYYCFFCGTLRHFLFYWFAIYSSSLREEYRPHPGNRTERKVAGS